MKLPMPFRDLSASNCCLQSYRALAHELRTPLATLLFVFELIERTIALPSTAEREARLVTILKSGRSQIEALSQQIGALTPESNASELKSA